MNKKEKEIFCCACGKSFIGKRSYFCPECRIKRLHKSRKKVAADKEIKKAEGRKEKTGLKMLAELNARAENADKFLKPEVCPNYDKMNISCVTCPAGAFKFKSCGRKK